MIEITHGMVQAARECRHGVPLHPGEECGLCHISRGPDEGTRLGGGGPYRLENGGDLRIDTDRLQAALDKIRSVGTMGAARLGTVLDDANERIAELEERIDCLQAECELLEVDNERLRYEANAARPPVESFTVSREDIYRKVRFGSEDLSGFEKHLVSKAIEGLNAGLGSDGARPAIGHVQERRFGKSLVIRYSEED